MSPSRPNPLIALPALLLLAGCEANTAPVAKSERPVQVQRVAFENENAARDFVGVVRARYEAEISAANSNLIQTAADLERYTALRTRGFASVADFDRKKLAKDEAEGRLE